MAIAHSIADLSAALQWMHRTGWTGGVLDNVTLLSDLPEADAALSGWLHTASKHSLQDTVP